MRSSAALHFWQPLLSKLYDNLILTCLVSLERWRWSTWKDLGHCCVFNHGKHDAIEAPLNGASKLLAHFISNVTNTWYRKHTSIRITPSCKQSRLRFRFSRHLVHQWASEIMRATNELDVVLYYGDSRDISSAYKVVERLSKDHHFFNGNSRNHKLVITSSYQTFTARHGPAEKNEWRQEKEQASEVGNFFWQRKGS